MLAFFRGHSGPVTQLAYRPDGRQVATASKDGPARLWPVDLIPAIERFAPPGDDGRGAEAVRAGPLRAGRLRAAPSLAITPRPGKPLGGARPDRDAAEPGEGRGRGLRPGLGPEGEGAGPPPGPAGRRARARRDPTAPEAGTA